MDETEIVGCLQAIHKLLVGIAMDLYTLSEKLPVASGQGERVSSAEVKTSTRGLDVAVKAYVGSDVTPAVDQAVAEYQRAQELIRDGGAKWLN